MIYTLTLNPAIDLFVETQHLQKDIVNRTNSYDIQANGKGVNVSLVLKMLGFDNCALGIGGGFTLDYIADYLQNKGIESNFLHVSGITRINVFTRVIEPNEEYKLVNPGPKVDQKTVDQMIDMIKKLKSNDFLIVSGSFAEGVHPSVLIQIAQLSNIQGFNLVIDTSYKEVLEVLSYQPYLLKPDQEELMDWFQVKETPDLEGYQNLCRQLIDRGAKRVLLSLGGQGALYVDFMNTYFGNAPMAKVVNTACSGDTMLGTFIAGLIQSKPLSDNLADCIAAGSSTAFRAGLTDFSDVEELKQQIKVEEIGGK